jgi:nitrogen fixation/metabolism regulation signal transduction histidine kinase
MGVKRLRHKLLLVFLAATLLPLAAILWMSSALMERSLAFVSTNDVGELATSLERVGREYYRQARERLKADAASGRVPPQQLLQAGRARWPPPLQQFWESADSERFMLSEPDGDILLYATRHGSELWLYAMDLGGVHLGEARRQLQQARRRAGDLRQRNLPRGFTLALLLSSAVIWVISLAGVVYLSSRISQPIQRLTAGLMQVAEGRFDIRLESNGHDEISRAVEAFNHTAGELQQNRNRLVYLTQVASWQMLARKMAHELKNSLTPIRLTVEEILARQPSAEPAFLERAATIVVDEVESLERRVRAFSEFAAEPRAQPVALDVNAVLRERIEFLRAAHPSVTYRVDLADNLPPAWADADQVKGILTNLLENAAEASGEGGTVVGVTGRDQRNVVVEVHDSGPGLSPEARAMLFEPSISFKKRGMGLGLAISRKNALLAGGDLMAIDGRLSGAGFRLLVPPADVRADR